MPQVSSLRLFIRIHIRNYNIIIRSLHRTPRLSGAPHGDDPIKNFEDFKWPNQVSTFEHYRLPQDLLDNEYNYPVNHDTMGIRWPGYWFKRKFVYAEEMEPQLVVPELDGFPLKPYVSYRTEDVVTKNFTAKDLFDEVYREGVVEQFGKKPTQNYIVSQEEIDRARLVATQTGSDLFEERPLDGVRGPLEYA